jgi:uncharacterized protein (TIGR02147 family)
VEQVTELKFQRQRDFRVYLQQELIRRSKANPKYSLRAFARYLGVQPSFLSKILLKQRSVTVKTIHKFGLKLGLNPKEIQKYSQQIPARANGKSSVAETQGAPDYHTLVFDHYQVIADWYHYAILELSSVKYFSPSPKWIAKTLGITITETNAAIERLERLDFIEINTDGSWKILDGFNRTTIGTELTAAALRKMQKQIIEKSLVALEEVSIEKRDQTSMTMAIDSSLLPEAKKRITKFRRELCSFLESGPNRDQVYQLAVSLYPVTAIMNSNGGNK